MSFPELPRPEWFFAPLSPQPCPHGSSLLVFPPVVLRQCPFSPHLSGVIASVHLFPSVFIAIVVEAMVPGLDVSMGPSGPSLTRLLLWGLVLSWVRFHLLSPVVVVCDVWFSQSPGELAVPASPLVFTEMYLTFVVVAVRPTHGGMCHLLSW